MHAEHKQLAIMARECLQLSGSQINQTATTACTRAQTRSIAVGVSGSPGKYINTA